MKPSLLLLIIVSLSLTIVISGFVSGTECNADLSQGGDSCNVSSSLGGCYEI